MADIFILLSKITVGNLGYYYKLLNTNTNY